MIFLDSGLDGKKVGQILVAMRASERGGIAGIHFQMIAPLNKVTLLLEIFPIIRDWWEEEI